MVNLVDSSAHVYHASGVEAAELFYINLNAAIAWVTGTGSLREYWGRVEEHAAGNKTQYSQRESGHLCVRVVTPGKEVSPWWGVCEGCLWIGK